MTASPADDRITPKLAALHVYQLSIPAPKPPQAPFDFAAERGEALFNGKAQCARCHVPPLFTEPGWNAHAPADVCVDSFQADRALDRIYRTRRSEGYLRIRRATSIMMAALRRCPTWSTTTTGA